MNQKINTMKFDNKYTAIISYDPEIEMFRGEFVNLNGGADFYASNIKDLKKEGELSLQAFLEMCKENGISPLKNFSGKLHLRMRKSMHQKIADVAKINKKSINQIIIDAIDKELQAN